MQGVMFVMFNFGLEFGQQQFLITILPWKKKNRK